MMGKLLDSFRQLFNRQPESGDHTLPTSSVIDENTVTMLMRRIELTNEGEFSCEETFDLLDEYVERAAAEQNLAVLMPLVKKHVDHCPDCGPRYEILLDILQNT